ncbi:SLATT domain-containing protein [Oceanospirillum sediminis]|uniref:SLATT domain-containing protein n=1 Tax=Oceanospirillum sediminis TaxID=2760088 RepID=A0A839ILH5_9GAMM|nr:SLATT domain-containing protein [Oceanospirillum sediminis]MBB1485808.1 SLATT domain-containing protein [Oceanospirillum sediminis]
MWAFFYGSAKKIIGENKEIREREEPAFKFLKSLHVAAKCRYNASIRLKHQSSFSFVTATVLSLGLILMPLLKLAGVRFSINDLLLDAFQIFLAVSVLVYSVVISKSKYDVRSSNINACGDKIKFLARELEYELGQCKNLNAFDYHDFRDRYYSIDSDIEDHTLLDYELARLNMPQYFEVTGGVRFVIRLWCLLKYLYIYMVPLIVIFLEGAVIIISLQPSTPLDFIHVN